MKLLVPQLIFKFKAEILSNFDTCSKVYQRSGKIKRFKLLNYIILQLEQNITSQRISDSSSSQKAL